MHLQSLSIEMRVVRSSPLLSMLEVCELYGFAQTVTQLVVKHLSLRCIRLVCS